MLLGAEGQLLIWWIPEGCRLRQAPSGLANWNGSRYHVCWHWLVLETSACWEGLGAVGWKECPCLQYCSLLCSPGRNPTNPRTACKPSHFIHTGPEAPGLTYTSSSFRAFAFVSHVQNVKEKKFPLCNQSPSLRQSVNHFNSSLFPGAIWDGLILVSPEGETYWVSHPHWCACGCVRAACSALLPCTMPAAYAAVPPHPIPSITRSLSPQSLWLEETSVSPRSNRVRGWGGMRRGNADTQTRALLQN